MVNTGNEDFQWCQLLPGEKTVVMLNLPLRGFAEVLIGVNFFQTELLLLQPVVYKEGKTSTDGRHTLTGGRQHLTHLMGCSEV